MPRPSLPAPRREDFWHHLTLPTRWMDNDIYGHVNNVVYYSFFDTVINRYLIEQGGLDIHRGEVIGLAVETACQFLQPLAYPDVIEAGLRVAHLGTSSVRYEVGIFGPGGCAAYGHFVHVFVDRGARRPVPLPAGLRAALEKIHGGEGPPAAT